MTFGSCGNGRYTSTRSPASSTVDAGTVRPQIPSVGATGSEGCASRNRARSTASAAVVYNLTPGRHTVTATSPTCTQIPYPYTDTTTGLTYDGTVTTQAGTGDSFIRVFLK